MKVILELYRDGSRVMFMVFNGTGSDLESWMSSFRLMTSSWAMLSPSSNFIYFSLKGYNLILNEFNKTNIVKQRGYDY